jgi:hypothetical protein
MSDHLETLRQFRQGIYESFPYRRDSLLDLLDALSSNERARSTVELSLNPCFYLHNFVAKTTFCLTFGEGTCPHR